jgi:hypothetical protein
MSIDDLASAMRAKVTRDQCGDRIIAGRYGNIHEDGTGFLIAVLDQSANGRPKRWGNIKRKLAFCQLRQDGDSEGCLHLPRLPNRAEAALIRWAIGAKKRKEYGEATLARLRAQGFGVRQKRTVEGPVRAPEGLIGPKGAKVPV